MAARRKWVPIALGIGIFLLFLAAGGIYFSVAYLRQQMQVEPASAESAGPAFAEVHRQFGNRPPLIEMVNGRPQYVQTAETAGTPPAGERQSLDRLHVLAYESQDGRLVRLSLPFWLLRMKAEPIRLSAYASGFDDRGVDLRPEEIERHGPGVILDHTTPAGDRVLLWAK